MMRYALYARVSTDDQAERYGLAAQLYELRSHAAAHHYTVIGEYTDAITGANDTRPSLTRMIADARAGRFDVVLIHHPDRLSRGGVAHQFLIEEEIQKAGAAVDYLLIPRGSQGEAEWVLQKTQIASFAQYERAKIRERTMRGKMEKARRGLVPQGPIPYGYRQAEPGRLVVHEPEAAVIRRMFHALTDQHCSIRAIAHDLYDSGVRSPRGLSWVPGQVKRILSNELYIGRAWFNRYQGRGLKRLRPVAEWIAIPVPAIVAPWQFEQAQAQLQRNRLRFSGRPPSRFYLLRGLLRCGQCTRTWHGWSAHEARYYRCVTHQRYYYRDTCPTRMWPAEALETLIWSTVEGILRNPRVIAAQVDGYRTRLGVRDVEVRSEVAHVERQIADLDRQERRLVELFLGDETVDSPVVRAKLEEIAGRRRPLLATAEKIRTALVREEAETARHDSVAHYCALALKGLLSLAPEGRRQLLLALVDQVVIREKELEIQGVLPGRPVDAELSRASADSERFSASYRVVVPVQARS